MRKLTVIVLALLVAASAVAAEQWRNAELFKKGLPDSQYLAIGRGALAECSAEARVLVLKVLPASRPCGRDVSVSEYAECQMSIDSQARQREQLFQDSMVGCMAKKGWLLE